MPAVAVGASATLTGTPSAPAPAVTAAVTTGPHTAVYVPAPAGAEPVGPRLRLATQAETTRKLPRLSRRTLTIIGVVVAVLAGSGIAYAVLKPDAPSGATTIRRYFDDLAQGDTIRALSRVADANRYRVEEFPLLDAKALADSAHRPTDLRILDTEPLPYGEVTLESVQITYKVGDVTVNQTILAGQIPSEGEDYLLDEPFLSLSVQSSGGRRVTVNGIEVSPATAKGTLVFPGVYTATAEGSALLTGETKPANMQTGRSGAPIAVVRFVGPALAPGALETIRGQVKQYIDTCAQSKSTRPNDCPFNLFFYGDNGSATWKVKSYPNVVVDEPSSSDGRVTVRSASTGVVRYDVTYTDSSGAPQTDSGERVFTIRGTASAFGSAINVSMN